MDAERELPEQRCKHACAHAISKAAFSDPDAPASVTYGAVGPRLITEAALSLLEMNGTLDILKTWDMLPLLPNQVCACRSTRSLEWRCQVMLGRSQCTAWPCIGR